MAKPAVGVSSPSFTIPFFPFCGEMSDSDPNLFSDNDSNDFLDDEAFFSVLIFAPFDVQKNAKYAGFLEEMNLEVPASQKRPYLHIS